MKKAMTAIITSGAFGFLTRMMQLPSFGIDAVRISFPASSYCSGYAGTSNNFIFELSKGQDLTVGVKNNKPIRVLGPSGNVIPFKQKSSHLAEWRITENADYKIQLLGDGWTLLDICAIDTPDQPVFDPALGV